MSYQFYEKNAVGEDTKSYFIELRNKIKNKIRQYKNDNERESTIIHKNFIMKSFSSIEKKMKLGEYKTFQEFVKGINNFYVTLLENGPNLPNREVMYLDFMKKVLPQGAEIFLRNSEISIEKVKVLSE